MTCPPTPEHEDERLEALRRTCVLDSPRDEVFDRLARLASLVAACPIAAIGFTDATRHWYKARVGLDVTETPRDVAFCAHAILGDEPFVVEDALHDPRFAEVPLVAGAPGVRFYAGIPLVTEDGWRIGTLGVMDVVPRRLDAREQDALALVALQVMHELALRQPAGGRPEQEEALRRADAAALESARRKAEFLANTSHEIRTPMNGVIGMIDILLDSQLTDEQREFATCVRTSAHTLLRVLSDILDYSELEAGKLEVVQGPLDVRTVVQEAVEGFRDEARQKSLELDGMVAADVPQLVLGDAARVKQVLGKLICNAVKFTTAGSVRVAAALLRETPEDVVVRFTVRDTGIGIRPDAQAGLFDAFTQVDGSMTRRFGGTGLGLAISRHLVELMGGDIGVESSEGQGALFTFTIRFARAAQPQRPAPPAVAPPAAAPAGDARFTGRVLLAEDNPVSQRLMTVMLERLGCHVDVAGDGKAALEAVLARPYDLVFMDCEMPEMDGFESTAAIRAREHGRHTTIVALTAHTLVEDRQRCLDVGMDDHLSKPISMAELRAILGRWLAAAGAVLDDEIVEQVRALGESDPHFVSQILATFSADAPRRLDTLETALTGNDRAAAMMAVHALRGASGSVGAARLAKACAALEQALRGKAPAGVDALLAEVREAMASTMVALERAFAAAAPAASRPATAARVGSAPPRSG